jgi:hypothetical protein
MAITGCGLPRPLRPNCTGASGTPGVAYTWPSITGGVSMQDKVEAVGVAEAAPEVDEFDLDIRVGELAGLMASSWRPMNAQTDPVGCLPTAGVGAEGGTCNTENNTCATCAGQNTCATCVATCLGRNTCGGLTCPGGGPKCPLVP